MLLGPSTIHPCPGPLNLSYNRTCLSPGLPGHIFVPCRRCLTRGTSRIGSCTLIFSLTLRRYRFWNEVSKSIDGNHLCTQKDITCLSSCFAYHIILASGSECPASNSNTVLSCPVLAQDPENHPRGRQIGRVLAGDVQLGAGVLAGPRGVAARRAHGARGEPHWGRAACQGVTGESLGGTPARGALGGFVRASWGAGARPPFASVPWGLQSPGCKSMMGFR